MISWAENSESIGEDPQAPITGGFFNVEKGAKSTATFTFSEVKYIISGDIVFTDSNGQRVVAKAGEVVYIPRGSTGEVKSLTGVWAHQSDEFGSHL